MRTGLWIKRRQPFPRWQGRGFTLLELVLVMGIVAILAAIAVPTYRSVVERLKISTVTTDLLTIAQLVERYKLPHDGALPVSLAVLGNIPKSDPWGNPYQYLSFAEGPKGKIRKDHNLHPLNTAFDLYSMGPDGVSVPPLTGKPSRDDIIWAHDGAFIGKATDF